MKLISIDPPYELSKYATAMPKQLMPGEDPTPKPPKVVVEFTRAEFRDLALAIAENSDGSKLQAEFVNIAVEANLIQARKVDV